MRTQEKEAKEGGGGEEGRRFQTWEVCVEGWGGEKGGGGGERERGNFKIQYHYWITEKLY